MLHANLLSILKLRAGSLLRFILLVKPLKGAGPLSIAKPPQKRLGTGTAVQGRPSNTRLGYWHIGPGY